MYKDFYHLFNWFEYLTRADFTPDGNKLIIFVFIGPASPFNLIQLLSISYSFFLLMSSFWVEIYDRLQCHNAHILIPLDFFVYEDSEIMQTEKIVSVYCLAEQISETWINVNKLFHAAL